MAGVKVPLTFRIFNGDRLIREERLSLSVIKLGKVPSAHLRLDDETVSRMHAIIEVNGPDDVNIIDLGSTKGTFVNGQKVNKAKLQSGDAIVVGETKIELAIAQAEDVAERAKAPAPQPHDIVAASRPMPAPPPAPPPRVPAPAYAQAVAIPTGFQAAMASEVDDFGGARAVEVATMLGDSVVGVKHCIDPKGGKVTATTWLMFAIGIASLIAFVIAFYIAVDNAAYNKGALEYWTTKEHKPAYAYRPRTISPGFDWIAFGGLVCAIVTTTSALARMRKEKQTPWVRIGTAPGVEFPIEGSPSPDFELVGPRGDEFAVQLAHGMDGEMVVNGQATAIGDLLASGRSTISPLPQGAKIRARLGQTTFLISAVAAPRRHVVPLFAALENRVLSYFAGSLAVQLGIWALLQQVPVEESAANLDFPSHEETWVRAQMKSQEDPTQQQPEDKSDDGEQQSGGSGRAMALESGTMGKQDSTRTAGQYTMKQTQADPQLARRQALEAAREAGILGDAGLVRGGVFDSLTGTGDLSSGFDPTDTLGGLIGNEAGEMHGGFGYGRWGFGPGGGGTGWGTIGTGTFGTIGHGAGTGDGYGTGPGRGGMHNRTPGVPIATIGQPDAQGDLDKAIIRRYIKRNIEKIQYCYERELLAKPGLAGTVEIQFFITPSGTVATSNGAGVDPRVATCVADVIHTIEFPRPKGGGGVQVKYPFTFRPAGQ